MRAELSDKAELPNGDIEKLFVAMIAQGDKYPNYVKKLENAVRNGTIFEEAPYILAEHFKAGTVVIFGPDFAVSNLKDGFEPEKYEVARDMLLQEAKPQQWKEWVGAPIIYPDLFQGKPYGAVIMKAVADLEQLNDTVITLGNSMRAHIEHQVSNNNLPHQILEQLLSNPNKLKTEGERRMVTTVFVDIENFSGKSETLDPVELYKYTNLVLGGLDIFRKRGGHIKLTGDGFMAGFNYFSEKPNQNSLAVLSALEFQKGLKTKDPKTKVRIGIHTGIAAVGRLGSSDPNDPWFEFTVLGMAVNIAQRIEQAGKDPDVRRYFLCSTHVIKGCEDEGSKVVAVQAGTVKMKGFSTPMELYEILDIKLKKG